MSILILLASYNGEEFLPQQLASLQAQSYEDWHLLVRDDGSRDSTRTILENASLAIAEKEFVCMVGPNGGGKTTLLKLMLGLLEPQTGTVSVFGKPPMAGRKRVQTASIIKRFLACARSISSFACAALTVNGFSQSTCLPCSRQSLMFSKWNLCVLAM